MHFTNLLQREKVTSSGEVNSQIIQLPLVRSIDHMYVAAHSLEFKFFLIIQLTIIANQVFSDIIIPHVTVLL